MNDNWSVNLVSGLRTGFSGHQDVRFLRSVNLCLHQRRHKSNMDSPRYSGETLEYEILRSLSVQSKQYES